MYVPWGSEGGMTRFCAHNTLEWELSQFIAEANGDPHVEVEHVVSGQVVWRLRLGSTMAMRGSSAVKWLI